MDSILHCHWFAGAGKVFEGEHKTKLIAMTRIVVLFALLTIFISSTFSQDSLATKSRAKEPATYKLKPLTDGAIIAGGVGLSVLGVNLIKNKKDITQTELDAKKKSDIPFFDRGNAGWFSDKADKDSYIPFYAAFGMPIVFGLIDKNERQKFGQLMVLYTETMAITGALFTMSTGNVYRSRPYVYGTKVDAVKGAGYRLDNDSHRSFYAGHTAASAAGSFFAAKAFADLNPNSKLKPYVWGVAAAVPAVVGYLRFKAGMHFLSDNLLGYALGAGAGIFVPQLHKVKAFRSVSFLPSMESGSKGLIVIYHIK